ncbi:hypothetical protein AXF42_Ash006025 [Apostasia shenzhenica]|uniref:PGG domain-containing protein n=1 Tax=Apostasia shenzhenica TaxID=1088818 RepID=A0A2I0B015_9ASPA|nr:hypothetical protein AXF42_Ash006025 [Apostasia shenzhenica]
MCANPHSPVSDDVAAIPSFCRERSFRQNYEQIDEAIRRGDESFLRCHIHAVKEKKRSMRSGSEETVEFVSAVNLSGDPLLSVLISYEKFELAGRLLKDVDDESLLDRNLDGNTALHVAAAVGDKAMEISGLIIRQNRELLFKRNNDHETPLLKAALYGQRRFFWKLHQIFRELYAEYPDDDKPISIIQDIKKDGSNVLHCAIMGNSPRLALEIARSFPHLKTRRNDAAVTPLQLVVTLPAAFKSKMHVDSLDEFIYKSRWANLIIYRILKQSIPRIAYLEEQKLNHKQTMELVVCLAGDVDRWLCRMARKVKAEDDRKAKEDEAGSRRWFESPLITGAKMGLHEFVEKILEVYPQSANIVDLEGKNILQVAIQLGQEKILDMVAARIAGKNPVLPSRLLYARDEKDNTILHYAAEKTVAEEEADALQMQRELQWFEKVEKLVPKDLQYRRNSEEMTAHERFSEKHKEMTKLAKGQLTDLGKTCAGLVAAFVFASSFSIPGSGAGAGSGDSGIFSKTAFKVFTHAFVFGLSSAATALVLFLSLVTSSYKERDFRRSLPTKFFFAGLSFILALVSLLVAFSCNIFIQIYSGRRIGPKDLIPFVCELTIFPVFTLLVMTYRGSTFGVLSLVRHVWR